MKLQILAAAALALLAAVPAALSEEPHAVVAKGQESIESFTQVLDRYDEDSYDLESSDEDEELDAVGVAKSKSSGSRKRKRSRHRKRSRSRRRRRRRRRSRSRRRRRRSRTRSCRSNFCFDRPWSWECRHCRRFDSSTYTSSKLDIEELDMMEDSGDYSPSSGDYSPDSYSEDSEYSDYSSDIMTEDSYDSEDEDEDDEDEEFVAVGKSSKDSNKRSNKRSRRRRSRSRRRRRRSRTRSCRSSFCYDKPWSWECRHCRRSRNYYSTSKSSKLDIAEE